MRAILVFNPNATTTTDDVRDVIASALASEVELEVLATKQRGHATHLVAGAVHEGVDAVFALGGDGTANEIVQALAGTDVRLGVIPGGGANVFARALGLPNEPIAATSALLAALRTGRDHTINLGRAGDRYFTFNAGYGFDAAVVRSVEQHPALKRTLRQAAFVYLTAREWAVNRERRDPVLQLDLGDGVPRGPYAVAIIANTDPYTFLGPRPMRVTPEAAFDRGLDLVAIPRTTTVGLLRVVAGVFGRGGHLRSGLVDHWGDRDHITVTASVPQPLMVDGDYAGEHERVTFRSVPDGLRVLGPGRPVSPSPG